LHCADRHDRGGNETKVLAGSGPTNLHRVWDIDEVQRLGADTAVVGDRLNKQIRSAEAVAWSKGSSVDWANQSFTVARDRIYAAIPISSGPADLRNADTTRWSQIAAVQLKRAGVRLAAILNRVLVGRERGSYVLPQR